MTMTLEELRAELSLVANNGCVTCSRENIQEWRDASDAAIKERDELRDHEHMLSDIRIDRELRMRNAMQSEQRAVGRAEHAESELAALKQRIAKGRYIRSTRNGVIRTPVGWCEPNTDYTIITEANPPTETP